MSNGQLSFIKGQVVELPTGEIIRFKKDVGPGILNINDLQRFTQSGSDLAGPAFSAEEAAALRAGTSGFSQSVKDEFAGRTILKLDEGGTIQTTETTQQNQFATNEQGVRLYPEGKFKKGILGFVRIPTADNPNKVYALGPQGRMVENESDLRDLAGLPKTASLGEAFQFVQSVTPEQALSVAVTGFTVDGVPGPEFVASGVDETEPEPVTGGADITAEVFDPVAYKDTEAYKNLTDDEKKFVDTTYNLLKVGGEKEAEIYSNAIKQAKAISDPYFKAQLVLAEAEVKGSIAELNQDFDAKKEIIERAKKELLEDVDIATEFLTLEEQAEVARLSREFDQDLLTIADQAADKGLTFATGRRSRIEAERARGEQFADVVQSSQREFNLRKRELELRAERGDTDAARQLEDLTAKRGLSLERIGRRATEVLGTEATAELGVEGFTPVEGIPGTIEKEKQESILSDIGAFVELQQGFV